VSTLYPSLVFDFFEKCFRNVIKKIFCAFLWIVDRSTQLFAALKFYQKTKICIFNFLIINSQFHEPPIYTFSQIKMNFFQVKVALLRLFAAFVFLCHLLQSISLFFQNCIFYYQK